MWQLTSVDRLDVNACIKFDCRRGALQGSHVDPKLKNFFTEGVARFLAGSTADQRLQEAVQTKRYVLLATPRSGSTFLCDLLTSTGRMGNPTEHLKAWVGRYLATAGLQIGDFLQVLGRVCCTENGVFGTKIIINDFFDLLARSEEILLEELKHIPVFVLVRSDKAAQAFSNVRSNMLGVYHLKSSEEATEVAKTRFEPELEKVFDMERWLLRQEADLLDLLTSNHITPCLINYETLIQSKRCTTLMINEIGHRVGILPLDYVWPSLFPIGRLAHVAGLQKYKEYRSGISYYSARSEPALDEVLATGWCSIEHWGVRAVSTTASLKLPAQHPAQFEIVVVLDDEAPLADLAVDGDKAVLLENGGDRRRVRLLGMPNHGAQVIELSVAHGSFAIEEVAFFQSGSATALPTGHGRVVAITM